MRFTQIPKTETKVVSGTIEMSIEDLTKLRLMFSFDCSIPDLLHNLNSDIDRNQVVCFMGRVNNMLRNTTCDELRDVNPQSIKRGQTQCN